MMDIVMTYIRHNNNELKYDRHSKKCYFLGEKNNDDQEGGAHLWCWDTRRNTYKKRVFQEDVPSPLLFVIAFISLTHLLRTANPGYEFRTGEMINHLLFMDDLQLNSKSERALDSLTQTVRIFSKDTGIQFGIDKWAMLVMKKGKIVKSDGIQLPNDKVLKSLEVFRCARSR